MSKTIHVEIPDYLIETAKYLWNNRQEIPIKYSTFDYPEYGGLPKDLYSQLSPDDVDAIQEEIVTSKYVFDDKYEGHLVLRFNAYTFNEVLFKILKFSLMESLHKLDITP